MLTIAGSVVITGIVTSLFSAVATRIELSSRANGKDAWAGVREASARVARGERRAAHLRRTPRRFCDVASAARPTPVTTTSTPTVGCWSVRDVTCSGNDPDIVICPPAGTAWIPGTTLRTSETTAARTAASTCRRRILDHAIGRPRHQRSELVGKGDNRGKK